MTPATDSGERDLSPFTLASWLDLVRDSAQEALVPSASWPSLMALAGAFPGNLSNLFGLECRLNGGAGSPDFLVCVDTGRSRLPGLFVPGAITSSASPACSWSRVRAFCDAWTDPASPLYRDVFGIWLEFDLADAAEPFPNPSAFFGPDQMHGADPAAAERLFGLGLGLLQGRPVPAVRLAALRRCVAELPTGASVIQVGAMLGRGMDAATRICIKGLDGGDLLAYLERLQWTGPRARTRGLVRQLVPLVDWFILDLDVSSELEPRIGLECYVDARREGDRGHWAGLLAALHDWGLCTAPEFAALLAWPGQDSARRSAAVWPTPLRTMVRQGPPRADSFLNWDLHHIKLSLGPGDGPTAKAYLSVQHAFRLDLPA